MRLQRGRLSTYMYLMLLDCVHASLRAQRLLFMSGQGSEPDATGTSARTSSSQVAATLTLWIWLGHGVFWTSPDPPAQLGATVNSLRCPVHDTLPPSCVVFCGLAVVSCSVVRWRLLANQPRENSRESPHHAHRKPDASAKALY